jgi:hypothetical protein
MSRGSSTPVPLQAKILQYQNFIETTLKRDLAACLNLQEKIQQKHTDLSVESPRPHTHTRSQRTRAAVAQERI